MVKFTTKVKRFADGLVNHFSPEEVARREKTELEIQKRRLEIDKVKGKREAIRNKREECKRDPLDFKF